MVSDGERSGEEEVDYIPERAAVLAQSEQLPERSICSRDRIELLGIKWCWKYIAYAEDFERGTSQSPLY